MDHRRSQPARLHRVRHLGVAAFWVPSQGGVLDLAAANVFTALGGLCFLIGAVLLLPESAAAPRVTEPEAVSDSPPGELDLGR
jgi:hypothetical protein